MKLCIAMEDDSTIEATEVEMVPETTAEVETNTAEIAEQVGDVEELVTATEEAEADIETLQDVQEVMEESVEKGEGVDTSTAAIAQIAVESICARLGLNLKQKPIPSMESFGSTSSKLSATRISVENVKEIVVKVWTSIMKAVKMVWEKIKAFFSGLFKSRTALASHLATVKSQVEALDKAATASDDKLTGAVAKAFSLGGKADASTAAKIIESASKLNATNANVSLTANTLALKLLTATVDAGGTIASTLVDEVTKAVATLGVVSKKDDTTNYGHLLNNRTVALESKTDDKTTVFNIRLVDAGGTVAETAETLNALQMKTMIEAAIVLTEKMKSAEKAQKELEGVSKACSTVTDKVIKGTANQADDAEQRTALNEEAARVRQFNSLVASFGSSLPAVVYNTAKAAGDYVSASLAMHKPAKAAAAPAKTK